MGRGGTERPLPEPFGLRGHHTHAASEGNTRGRLTSMRRRETESWTLRVDCVMLATTCRISVWPLPHSYLPNRSSQFWQRTMTIWYLRDFSLALQRDNTACRTCRQHTVPAQDRSTRFQSRSSMVQYTAGAGVHDTSLVRGLASLLVERLVHIKKLGEGTARGVTLA